MSVRAHDLTVAGTRFGDARIEGNGTRGQLRIARISVAGGDARIDASGVVTMASAAQPYSGTLSGTGSADLGAFVSGGRIGGRVAGPFTAAFGNGQWLVSANARSTDAVVAGVPVHSVDATVGGDAAGFHLYAGIANFSGGQIAAAGDLPGPGSRGLTVFAHDIDSATLRAAGVPLQRGTMAALGTVAGTQANPNVSMAASLDGGEVAGHALAGDFDGNYDGGRLVARESRVAFLGGSIAFDGTIAGLQSGRPIKAAAVAVDARTSGADLAALSSQFAPKSIPLTGNVIAAVRVGGTIGAPTMAGRLGLDAGTVRGVPFTDFHAAMSAGDGAATVNRGAVRIGGSALRFGGSLTPGAVRLRVGSPHLDLSDFNNFFAGKDIVDGVGSTRLAFSSTTKGTTGNGFVRLSGAQFEGLPLGEVNAVLSTRDRAIVADARQAGNLGSISITGDVAFAAQRGIWPAFDTARYDARSSARDVDLSILAPIVHAEAAGIVGRLSFNAAAHGSPRRLVGDGGFAVRDGRVRDIAIRDLSGQIRSDGHSIEVRRLTVAVDAAQMQAHGRYGPTRKIDARASVQASDLSALGKVLKSSLPLTGSASMTLQAGGTLDKPRVRAVLDAFSGLFDGVAYDKITAAAAYAPGRVELSDTSVQLAKGRGGLVLTGSVPVQLSPFGIGPARQRIGLQLRASDVDLSTFNPLLGPSANLGGKFNAVASATGSAGSPRLAGSASLRNASVNSRFDTIPITGISADAEFVQDSITLKRFHASTGKGSLEARGAAKLVPSRDSAGVRYSAQVAFHDARADVPGYFNGTLNGGLRLAQDAQASSLTGTVAMSDTEVPFASILALATGRKDGPSAPPPIVPGVPKLQKGHTIVYGGALYGNEAQVVKATPPPEGSASKRAAPPIELDVIAQANKNVRVTGIVDVTTVGSVAVVGTASAPELAGVFNSVRGRVGAFGANFQLRRGSVTFDPAEGLLPTIDAQGITYASGTSITVTVTGRVDHLNTDLESEPPLPRDQIIGLLLHIPQLNQALSGGIGSASSQTGYGQVAQNLLNAQLSSQLLAPLTSALAQSLDISEINITFDAQGQPNLELRKQFGARTYAIYSNTFAVPYSQSVGFAYELSDVLAIEFLQNETAFNTPRIGNLPTATINIRYSFR
ncbi:MAG: translocation/assembly module TamB domain-containing protein [Candidatus Eremiobacteraeota bacterium]|nr:translocation/assembly module TamB domain-containing protein [Candidatus Eremiobacteraeota bacterium]